MTSANAKSWGRMRGETLLDSDVVPLSFTASDGFSLTGLRTLRLTDHPALYAHDTGGFLGDPRVVPIEKDFAERVGLSILLVDDEPRLSIEARFKGGESLTAVSMKRLATPVADKLWRLGAAAAPPAKGADLLAPIALPLRLVYESGRESDPRPTHLFVKDGRLIAAPVAESKARTEWPLARVALSKGEGGCLVMTGGAVANGRMVTGAKAIFPTPSLRERFRTAADALRGEGGAMATPTAVNAAMVGVRAEGGPFGDGQDVEAALSDTALEFCSRDGRTTFAAAALDDPRLAIGGTAQRFVLFAPAIGPVSVRVDRGAEAFSKRLLTRAEVKAAAERAEVGPFPLLLKSGAAEAAALARVEAGALHLESRFGARRHAIGAVREARPSFAGEAALALQIEGEDRALTLKAPPPLLEAFHVALRAESLAAAPPERLPDLLKAAAALEEDYFLTAVFGPCYELHAALVSPDWASTGAADLGGLLEPPAGDGAKANAERTRLAALFSGGLEALRRHFDRVAHVLPPFVRFQDGLIAADDGAPEPAWLKTHEAQLRGVLGVAARAGAELTHLSAMASRLGETVRAPDENYTAAAISLGAGLINPIFLVGAASQALSESNASAQRKAGAAEENIRLLNTVAARWLAFIGELAPMLSYTLTESLFAHRLETARRIAEEFERRDGAAAGLRRVAGRLARLDVRRRYPAAPVDAANFKSGRPPLTRGDIAEHIKSLRDAIGAGRFAAF